MSNLSSFVKRIRDIMRNDAGINGDAQRIEQIAWMLFLKVYDAKEQDWEINEDDYVSIIPEECRWVNWAHDDRSGSAMETKFRRHVHHLRSDDAGIHLTAFVILPERIKNMRVPELEAQDMSGAKVFKGHQFTAHEFLGLKLQAECRLLNKFHEG